MRFAVISDVQANLCALRAVLAAIEAREEGVERIVCAGDIVGLGPQPNEVLELLRERRIETVRGNYDDAVAFDRLSSGVDFPDAASEERDRAALRWTRQALSEENLAYVLELPRDVRLVPLITGISVKRDALYNRTREQGRSLFWRGMLGSFYRSAPRTTIKKVLVVHGSTRALNEPVRDDTANSILAALAREAQADVLISGHGGYGFEKAAVGMTFIGVPGVSGPYSTPGEAEYAIVDVDPEVSVGFRSATYNIAEFEEAMAMREFS